MMKVFVAIILLFVPGWICAQSLSVQELWGYLENSYGQQRQEREVLLRKAALEEVRKHRIPVLYADGNLQRNLIIPITPVPAIAFNPNAAEGAILPLKFSTKWSSKAGVQGEWKIFDPKHSSLMAEKALEVQKATIQKENDAEDWKRGATLAYVSVLLATQQYQQAQQDSSLYADIVDLVKARYDAGRETSSSYYEARQEMERKRIQLHQSWGVLLAADLELRKYIDLTAKLHLSTNMEGVYDFVRKRKQVSYVIKTLQVDRQISLMQLQALKREQWPVLTLNGYLGGQYFGNEPRLDRREEWFGNSFVNVALRIPISTYYTGKPAFRQAQLNTLIYENQIAEEERLQNISDKQRDLKLITAQKELLSLLEIKTLAKENVDKQEKAYRAGRLLLSDLNRAFLSYNSAIQDIWQAEFDRIALILE